MCNHKTCENLRKLNAAQAAAVIPLVYYNGKHGSYWAMYVGNELGGQYAGKYNLCAGKFEPSDQNCWIKCAMRELKEEYKIDLDNASFDALFRGSNGKIRVIMHNRTPVFVAVMPAGFSRKPIKAQMAADLQDPTKGHSYKEMDDIELIRLDNGKQIEGANISVSTFANAVRQKIDTNKL